MATTQEFAQGLRDLAQWYDEHPDAPVQADPAIVIYSIHTKAQIAAFASMLGTCEKEYAGSLFYVKKMFGPIRFAACIFREQVCSKVQVGVKRVMKSVPTAPCEMVDVEVEEPVFEWVCPPILEETKDGGA